MIWVARLLGILSVVLSTVPLLRFRNGFLSAAFWLPRVAASAWSPVLALAGSLAALWGVLGKDWWSPVAGVAGAAMAVRHVVSITARHPGFEEAFGADWQDRIPPDLKRRLLRRRYSPLLRPVARPVQLKNLVYAACGEGGIPLEADLWLPPPGVAPTGLAVLYLFGGAWHYMNKDLWTGHILRAIASQGHVVMNASYTLAPEADVRAMVGEIRQAIAWLKEHATSYGVDPERIVLMGCSSGAHLALLTAYTPHHSAFPAVQTDVSVRGIISDSGFVDMVPAHAYFEERFGRVLHRNLPLERWFLAGMGWIFRRTGLLPAGGQMVVPGEMVPSLLGGKPEERPDAYRLASPLSHVGPHCPPTLLLQGANDYCGIQLDVQRLDQALRAAGVPSVYVEFAEADHSFSVVTAGAPRWAPGIQAALQDIERFLALMV